jgi:predicted RNA methylase
MAYTDSSQVEVSQEKPLLPGTGDLILNLRQTLTYGNSLSTKELLARAQHYLQTPISSGAYDFRYLYDALEVALHSLIEERTESLRLLDPSQALEHIEQQLSLLPTQRVRTNEQSLFQQFSTPPPLAFVANFIAFLQNETPNPVVLEPSAGTGALACLARAFGAQVHTNDLSPTRRAFLQYLSFPVQAVDAEKIDDLLPPKIVPSIVLMNPPFSSTAGRLTKNDNSHGARHIESALYRLAENGRLVAITGCGLALDRQRAGDFWKRIADRYHVKLNLSLPAPTFTKFGTAWETQLIVIDKTGPTPGPSWQEQVNNIRFGPATLPEILALAKANALFQEASTSIATTAIDIPTISVSVGESTTSDTSSESPENETDEESNFVPYISARLTGGLDHPAALVETAAMAAVIPPPITYRPKLKPTLVTEGILSNPQLERICYAGQRHSQHLPTGARAAYVLGDGTGFGKGRVLSGIILDNHNHGRKRALWLSISNQLLESTRRDLNDLNGGHVALHQLNDWEVNDTINFDDGVIFCSYNTLIAKSRITRKTRLEQLIQWLGTDGVIILDECQRAQHALATEQGEATQTGLAVLDLQNHEERPDLRFVYSSATSVVEVSHMCYMDRLGLWGPETSFPEGFVQFMAEIEAGGLGALEMVTRSMKAFGMSHASTLSYGRDPVSGLAVEYAEVFHQLTPKQREIYDNAAGAWQVVLKNIAEALDITSTNSRKRAFTYSHFWAQHQAFFRQVITAFKVPACIKQIEAALKRNESAVISIIGTAESKSKVLVSRAAAEGNKLEDLDFSPRATLCALVERAFPIDLYEEKTDPATGNKISVRVTDHEGNPVQSREAIRMRDELLEKLSDLVLPENPLDQIINYFGPEQVAEISGRRKRLIRDPQTKEVNYVSRAPKGVPMSKINIYENEQFQNGNKRIAIITAAGSTGISLHASLNVKNQQRRCHIVLELAWSAVLQMQSFGRTHRSFQASPPKYILLSTDLGGERRFSATIARRLASLGALCKGDRKAADGVSQLSRYSFESPLGRGALDLLYRRIFTGTKVPDLENPRHALKDMGLLNQDGEVNDQDRHHIPRFLNRLLSLDCDRQNALFNYYAGLFDECVAHSKASGAFDDGVQDIKALSIRLAQEPETVYVDETTNAETLHYTLAIETKSTTVSPERIAEMQNQASGTFYRQTNGKIILITKSGNHTNHESGETYQTYAVTKPEEERAYYINQTDLQKYKKVSKRTALAWWALYSQSLPETRTEELHLIAGAVLPLWQRLKTNHDAQLKVVRVITEDNQRIVGVKIPANRVQQVLRALGIANVISDPAEIFTAVLKNDDQIALIEGLSLSRARIYGTSYIELKGASHHKFQELRDLGLINMQIDYRHRFTLPKDEDDAIDLLQKLLARYPIDQPIEDAPLEIPLPTSELRALAQAETVDIFDLLDAPRPTILPTTPPPPSKPVENLDTPTIYKSGFVPAQLSFWGPLEQAA